jgi:hypothetical protein
MKWNVDVDLNASMVVTVEADSAEEAKQKAIRATSLSSIRMADVEVYEIAGVLDAWEIGEAEAE